MGKTILVVDDEEDVRSTLKTILEKEGFTITTAENADDALIKLKTNTPDLILLDIMMPGTPVKEVVKEIKKIKIAFLTTVQTSEDQKKELLKQENIVDFIQKPLDLEDIIKRVKKILS